MRVTVRRFRCAEPGCRRRIFAEQLGDAVAGRSARRTSRLELIVRHLGIANLGKAGAENLVTETAMRERFSDYQSRYNAPARVPMLISRRRRARRHPLPRNSSRLISATPNTRGPVTVHRQRKRAAPPSSPYVYQDAWRQSRAWQDIGWTSSNRAVSRVIPPPYCGGVAIYTRLTMLPQKLRPRICIAVTHLSRL
jgi:hypothetical protein